MTYDEILKRKIDYYGKTDAAFEFAADEYAQYKVKEARTKDEKDQRHIFKSSGMEQAEIATANFYHIRNPN